MQHPVHTHPRRRLAAAIALAATLAMTTAITSGCGLFPKEVEEPAPVIAAPVKSEKAIYTVKKSDIVDEVKLNARLTAAKSQDIAWKNPGRIKAVYVRSGDQVKAGQMLAELYSDDAEQALAKAEISFKQQEMDYQELQRQIAAKDPNADASAMKNAEMALGQARLDLQLLQQKQAAGDDVAVQLSQAQAKLEKAQSDLEAAKAKAASQDAQISDQVRLQKAELSLKSSRMDLDNWRAKVTDARLLAPFDGQVMSVTAKVGENAGAFEAMFSLADPTQLVVDADVDDTALTKLAVGQRVRLEFTDLTAGLKGTVVELPDPNAKATSGAQPKRIKIRPDKLEKGQMGIVGKAYVILQEKKGVLLLENAGLRSFTGRNYVQLANPRREVDVVLGIQGELVTEITKGLKEGDQVIGR